MHPHRRIDAAERAHLGDRDGYSPPVHRFAPAPGLADLVRRYWMPVWSLPEGSTTVQRVLQYPVCQLVVAPSYALLVGPAHGLTTRELTGSGWALGAMLQPAAGALLLDGPVSAVTDGAVPLDDLAAVDGPALAGRVRAAVGDTPPIRRDSRPRSGRWRRRWPLLPPADEEGLLVNAVVEYVENESTVERVSQVCEKFALSERSLQRLTRASDRAVAEVADPAPAAARGGRSARRRRDTRPGHGRGPARLRRPGPLHAATSARSPG